MFLPRDRMVRAEHDLAGADLSDEMAECLGSKHQGVEEKLIEIFRGLLLQLYFRVAVLRRDETGVVRTRRVGWQIAAAMRRDDLQAWIFVERALEDEVLQRDRGRSEEHTSELQSHSDLVCRLLLEKKKKKENRSVHTARQYKTQHHANSQKEKYDKEMSIESETKKTQRDTNRTNI